MSSSTHAADTKTGAAKNHRAVVRDHALAALAETNADGEAVKATVLRELYRQQPTISLEDTLELNAVVKPPEAGPLDERIGTVLSEAVEQYDDWTTTSTAPAGDNTSVPATEDH